MWCCVGSGIENHSKYGELIFAHDNDQLFVNLFIPSRLDWQQQGVEVAIDTRFPDEDQLSLSVTPKQTASTQRLTLNIRKPAWITGQNMQLKLNGKPVTAQALNPGYMSIRRQWQAGDKLTISMRMEPYLEGLPDGSQQYSVLYGPVVLAEKVQPFANEQLAYFADDSRMGHVAAGPTCSAEALPVIVGDTDSFLHGLKRKPGAQLAFSAGPGLQTGSGAETQTGATLIPFFRIHESRYQLYFPQMQASEYQDFMRQAEQRNRAEQLLAAQTVDQLNPGEQQPETEHGFAGEGSRAGVNGQRHWRDATDWFSYQLSDPKGQGAILRLGYFSGDQGRQFTIYINGIKLADVSLQANAQEAFYEVDYPLSAAIRASLQNGKYTLKLVAKPGSIAGGLYGVRLLKSAAN